MSVWTSTSRPIARVATMITASAAGTPDAGLAASVELTSVIPHRRLADPPRHPGDRHAHHGEKAPEPGEAFSARHLLRVGVGKRRERVDRKPEAHCREHEREEGGHL